MILLVYEVSLLSNIKIDALDRVSCCKLIKEYDLSNLTDVKHLQRLGLFSNSVVLLNYVLNYCSEGGEDVIDYLLGELSRLELLRYKDIISLHLNLMKNPSLSSDFITVVVNYYNVLGVDVSDLIRSSIEEKNLFYLDMLLMKYKCELSDANIRYMLNSNDKYYLDYISKRFDKLCLDNVLWERLYILSCRFGNDILLKKLSNFIGDKVLFYRGMLECIHYERKSSIYLLLSLRSDWVDLIDASIKQLLCEKNLVEVLSYMVENGLELWDEVNDMIEISNDNCSYEMLEYLGEL
jgi:hypothetical protein